MIEQKDNVIKAPARREMISHKGLHAWLEYRPAKKLWEYTLKLVYNVTHKGSHTQKEEAALEVKRLMDVAAEGKGKNVRSID